MARKRLIDAEALYYDSEIVSLLGERGLHLYIRLWTLAEDWGGYEPKYANIAFQMGALFFKPEEAQRFIEILIEKGKIITFKVNGTTYHWLKNLMKHQELNRARPPKLPLPKWISFEVKQYESGKKYAIYKLDDKKLTSIETKSDSPRTVLGQSGEFLGQYQDCQKRNETKLYRNDTNSRPCEFCG